MVDLLDVGGVKEAILHLNLSKERRLDSESLCKMVNDVVEGIVRRQREEDLVETVGGEDAVCAGKLGEIGPFSEFVAPVFDGRLIVAIHHFEAGGLDVAELLDDLAGGEFLARIIEEGIVPVDASLGNENRVVLGEIVMVADEADEIVAEFFEMIGKSSLVVLLPKTTEEDSLGNLFFLLGHGSGDQLIGEGLLDDLLVLFW